MWWMNYLLNSQRNSSFRTGPLIPNGSHALKGSAFKDQLDYFKKSNTCWKLAYTKLLNISVYLAPPAAIYAQPHNKNQGVDLRYAATYGNPYLRNSSLGNIRFQNWLLTRITNLLTEWQVSGLDLQNIIISFILVNFFVNSHYKYLDPCGVIQ